MNRLIIKAIDYRDRALAATRRLLREERGDAVQWIMGLCIAAVIIVALFVFGQKGLKRLDEFWKIFGG